MKKILQIALLGLLAMAFLGTSAWAGGTKEGGAAAERVKLTMFMNNSGVPQPNGVDPSDNWALKIVEDCANVDLVMEIPAYADVATKLNLLLASGNLPDIVHGTLVNEMALAADAGAFLDLKKYYDQSAQMKKWVSPVAMELAASNAGKWWAVPMVSQGVDAGRSNLLRWDLLVKYNGGKSLETVEDYVKWLKWIKDTIPGSIPLSSRNNPANGQIFINGAGLMTYYVGTSGPFGSRIQDGKFISNLYLPEMKEAVKLYRQLYADGILDKEFATQPADQYFTKVTNQNVALQTNNIDQLVPGYGTFFENGKLKEAQKGALWVFAAPLKTYPSVLKDQKYTWDMNWGPIVGHRVAISTKSKYPDRAWKVLECFTSDALRNVYAYGREGKEFTMKDGQRVLTPGSKLNKRNIEDPDEQYWTINLNFIMGFWPTEARYWVAQQQVPAEDWKRVYDSSRPLHEWALKNGPGFSNFIKTPAEISKVSTEMSALTSAIVSKTIIGEYSLEDWDSQVKAFKDKYGFVDDTWTKLITEKKADLIKFGAVSVNW